MSKLFDYFIRHRLAANICMLMMILAGLFGALRMKQTFYPELEFNEIQVSIAWPGASADNVAQWIATPLSNSLEAVANVEEVSSYSDSGYASFYVKVAYGANMQKAEEDIKAQVDRFQLPQGAERPDVSRFEFQEVVYYYSLTGPNIDELRPIASELRKELLALGIPRVDLNGTQAQRLEVTVPIAALSNLDLSIDTLAQQIAMVNRDYSASQIGEDYKSRSIRSSGYSTELNDLKNLPVQTSGGSIALGDVANIEYSNIPGQAKISVNGQPAIELQVYRDHSVDSVAVANLFEPWVEKTNATLPQGMALVEVFNLAEFVIGSRNMLLANAAAGLALVLVLLFFMLNRRVAFWTAVGVPVSILGTLAFLYSQDVTLNFFTIFSLLMALGIIVDDAIVVGEESLTLFQQGKSPHEAALLGAKRMFGPIMASSLTTIAAFSPLLFLPGEFGQLLKPIPLVIICVVIASIVECFVILPAHLRHSFEGMQKKPPNKLRLRIEHAIDWVRQKPYRAFATFALSHRFLTVSITLGSLIIALALVISQRVGFEGDVNAENDQIMARIHFVDGTPNSVIDEMVLAARDALELANNELSAQNLVEVLIDERYYHSNSVFFLATLSPRDDRQVSNVQVLNKWRDNLPDSSWVYYVSMGDQQRGGSANADTIGFFIAGDVTLDTLRVAVDDFKEELKRYPELQEVEDNLGKGAVEVTFDLLPQAERIGMTAANISQQLRAAIDGSQVQNFVRHGRDTDIVVVLPQTEREDQHILAGIPIRLPNGQTTPLGTLVTFGSDTSASAIYMQDGQVGAEITAKVVSDTTTVAELSREISQTVLPTILTRYNLQADFTGGNQSEQELLNNLMFAGLGALALIYLVLAWSFASWSWPLAVMAAIPLAITGAIYGHALLGLNLNVLSIFGFFALGGIIVNDSIILVTRYRELLAEGMDRKLAIVEASVQRFRAVILTTLTTVFGLLPLLFETSVNAQLVRSMAVSLAFGLSFGTLLVLVIVPCLLSYIESMRNGMKRLRGKPAM
ncbi:efflux RND transporter permease subunit [Salinibius halmophilus]|uniref:efflux RND transporter permease subunit n=1 Tax=Salinibius halmophilus TaxID=1853216 RepID=UPI000E666ACD|nr:efflux RND transporter permease subunit [Salinibius halmophilus]